MKQNNKQELSYFRLKLKSYMSEYHPERLQDTEFITARADMALTAYCDAVAQGFTHPEAESMASEVLFQGLHFSKYDTLVSVLENEFERELPAPLLEKLVSILLLNKAVQATFDKFGLTDTFASDEQYDRLYTELTDTIVLLMESNKLPTVGQADG
ncbi:DUF1896 domain-containing protein [Segatella oris]|uniref:DUF1896 domain-containing protein n=1 Tax=Segatella oris C735 TaxID=563008 RepID=D7NF83_9BACT|nr:DUF1896 domain-containing protein [Segatella oris]EFI47712.1 conserved hypothetical protein [Segatella oris C735]